MLKGEWTTEEVRINKKTAATSNHLSIKKKIKRKHYIRELNCYVLILNCHQIICWLNLGFYESIILNKHFPHNINFNFWVDHTIKVKWRGGNRCWSQFHWVGPVWPMLVCLFQAKNLGHVSLAKARVLWFIRPRMRLASHNSDNLSWQWKDKFQVPWLRGHLWWFDLLRIKSLLQLISSLPLLWPSIYGNQSSSDHFLFYH